MMTWNCRVVVQKDTNGDDYFGIHEIYYSEDGKPTSRTVKPVASFGDTLDALKKDHIRMLKAFEQAVLRVVVDGDNESLIEV